jgi:hypothetical protein
MMILPTLTDTKMYIYVLFGWSPSCFALVAESVSTTTSSFNVVEENVFCTSSVGKVVWTTVTSSTVPDGDKTISTAAVVGVLDSKIVVVAEGDDVIITDSSNCDAIVGVSVTTGGSVGLAVVGVLVTTGDNVSINGGSVGIGAGANVCSIVVVGALVIITSSSTAALIVIVTLAVGTFDPSTSIKPHSLSSG